MTSEAATPDPSSTSHTRRAPDRLRSLRLWFVGPPDIDRLTITHCVNSAAETFFTISLAGSIFFSVSPDAARPRVLLFLVLTLGPFLVMAPLVGPIVDRVRGGVTVMMVATFALRAGLALLLAANLRTLLLFPLAFGVLVLAKTYSVTRNALVPSLVTDENDLVAANARLSRSATIVGGVAAFAAVALFASTDGAWTLRVAAVLYALGLYRSWLVRSAAPELPPVEQDAYVELIRPDVSGAVWDMAALRAAIGFALFQLGFSLRAAGEPAWVIGAVILANGVGGFVGTVVSPLLRDRVSERSMFTISLVGAAVAVGAAGFLLNGATIVGAVFVLGLAASVGRRALDATIQRMAPHARRGQVYAGLETRLEAAWVAAACLAVALRVATWIGVLMLAAFLTVAAAAHLRRRAGLRLILRPAAALPLPERLILRAETLLDHHFYDEAIVVATAALQESGRPAGAVGGAGPPVATNGGDRLPSADPHALRRRAEQAISDARAALAHAGRTSD